MDRPTDSGDEKYRQMDRPTDREEIYVYMYLI